MDDLKNGESNYNPGDGTDQRVQSLVFMMMMIILFCIMLVRLLIKEVKMAKEQGVYKLICPDCNKTYVGRPFSICYKEHMTITATIPVSQNTLSRNLTHLAS